MSALIAAVWAEILKARRSRVPVLTGIGFALAPLMGGLFMLILKEPQRARSLGLISAKAQIVAGTADWPTYLGLTAQATAVGGSLLFAFVTAWVFGREFADRTVKLVLAVGTPRHATVAAKLLTVAIWCALLSAGNFCLSLAVGALVGLPGWSLLVLRGAAETVAGTTVLVIALMPVTALMASAGRGYLAPLGFAILTLFLAQILAATGWGALFPWSVPALFSGLAGPSAASMDAASYWIVAITGAVGLVGTFMWWRLADQRA